MPYMDADGARNRSRTLSSDTEKYTDEMIENAIEEFENTAERYRGVAYITRSTSETVQIVGGQFQLRPKLQTLTSVTVEGVAQNSTTWELDTETGRVWWLNSNYRNPFATVVYTHGYTTTPEPILAACVQFVRCTLLADQSTIERDVISVSADGIVSRYSTPNWAQGRPTGWDTVDRRLNSMPDYRTLKMFR